MQVNKTMIMRVRLCQSPVADNPGGDNIEIGQVGTHGAQVDQVRNSMCNPKLHPSFLPFWSSFFMLPHLQHKLSDLGEDHEAVKDVDNQASSKKIGCSVNRMVD